MNKGRIVAAIDIGSHKTATLIAQIAEDEVTFNTSVNIVGAASSISKGVKKGQIVNIEEAVETTIISVEAAERMAGYNLDSAFISVGGAHVSSHNSTGVVAISDPEGEVSTNDVLRVIEAARAVSLPASREIIHVLPRQFIVDGEPGVKDPVGMSGVRLEVETHLISCSLAALKNLTKTINEVGVDIEEVVFSGLASAEAILTPTEKELGCVLVDIGAGTTSVAAFIDGALAYSGAIPIGARNVTNDLAIGLRVSLESAEKIKLALSKKKKDSKKDISDQIDISDFGVEERKKISRRTLVEGIIKPRLNEIFTIVKLDLEKTEIINRVPSGLIVTGGGAQTVAIADSAKRITSLPVRIGTPTGITGLIDDVCIPPFATSVGLLLYAAKQPHKQPSGFWGANFKLPSKGAVGKIIESVKDLLP
jgi:cell division protein FtsA